MELSPSGTTVGFGVKTFGAVEMVAFKDFSNTVVVEISVELVFVSMTSTLVTRFANVDNAAKVVWAIDVETVDATVDSDIAVVVLRFLLSSNAMSIVVAGIAVTGKVPGVEVVTDTVVPGTVGDDCVDDTLDFGDFGDFLDFLLDDFEVANFCGGAVGTAVVVIKVDIVD